MGLKRGKFLVHILILIIASPIILSLIPTVQAIDSVRYPSGPEEFVFVYDNEDIISADDEIEIQGISEKLHNETGIPIVVVVINRMIDYQWSGSIEGYALRLFDEWGIGYAEHNYGMLLLISVQDREARIELGHSWSGTINDECDSIMQDLLVPKFKDGKFSEGILGGVEALSDVAKGGEVSGLALKLF
ncbi:MAG: TPM domain-containing protein, partial [Candidatus Thalassarchaeaceae archaeon]|nr:TPM domain-containing protein [Candidatus Thalassarchaeaceae archaeon]